jgi:hypothetical protein
MSDINFPIFQSINTKLLLATVSIISITSLALNFVIIRDIDSLTGATAALAVQDAKVQIQHRNQNEVLNQSVRLNDGAGNPC